MQLLMIEDNEDDYLLLSWYATKIGDITIEWRDSLQRGLAYLASHQVDVLLLDLALPDGHGLATLDQVQKQFPTLPIIILSGYDDDEMSLEAVHRGAQDYLVKGQIDDWILKKSIRYAVERKRTEQALVAERNMLRTLIDSTPDYIFVKDAEGRVIITNQANAELVGVSPQEVIGKTASEIFSPELAEAYDADDRYVLQSGKPLINLESDIIDAYGNIKTLLITKIPLQDEYGQSAGLVSISRDITDRKKVEEKLRDEHNLLRTVIDNVPDYIFVKDADSKLTLANRAVIRDVGATSLTEVIGKSDFDFLPHELAEKYYAEEQELLKSGQALVNKTDQITIHTEGSPRWVLSTKVPLKDSDGNIVGLVGINRDITDHMQVEEKFHQERDLLRALIDSTPDYIFIKDAQKRFVISNIAHAQAVKTNSDELVGKTASEVFPPEFADQYHVDDDHVIETGESLINLERSTVNENGNTITVLTSKIPLLDKDGQVTNVVGISRDITERKQLEARSLELAGERERIRVLQRFIDDMSHDLRTPLAIVGSSLYLIQKNTDPDKQQAHIQKIERQLQRLDKLLNEMLEMAQLDRHDMRLQIEPTDINTYLQPIIQEYEPIAAAKQISIEFDPEDKPCLVHIDTVEFASAFIKLLENAIAYTSEGGRIDISTHIWQDQTIISVQDTGIGIAGQDLPHIFERFYRADQARSTATGGHGLGLSIAQSIIEAHGGSIKGESAVGRGSTFTVTLLNS